MTRVRTALPALAVAVAAALGPGAAPVSAETPLQRADRLMTMGYAEFARQPHAAPFDWETDGCTGLDVARQATFRQACVQHDFGYGNYGPSSTLRLDPTDTRRAWIDKRFYQEMRQICTDQHGSDGQCMADAETIYGGVRLLGGLRW
ncbi:hypothetical protein GCM10010145_61280 [Streptomyces ruber]|uniref:Prokaryotic phospholipase A2 n=2 Tax=Streptomyces TaxID=1883 RepID=A0A918BPA4_9ACTN|nr:phospholipase A2 [Streptomyces ruber]GGQ83489.1 hypothetical protein GCM10010145_61280 [Streptomyces ruber]